jgi:hypothetical protein
MAKSKQAKTSHTGAATRTSAKRAGGRSAKTTAKAPANPPATPAPDIAAPAFGAPEKGCRIRLKVTYYIADPARWWTAFHKDIPHQQKAGIFVHDLRCRYKPLRHQGHPYKIVLRAKVHERAPAEYFMRSKLSHDVGKRAGILLETVTNRWRGPRSG